MKKTAWITVLVFALSMAVCCFSKLSVDRIVKHARHLRTEAMLAMDAHDVQRAEVVLVELASFMKEKQPLLEIICDHNNLHEMKGNIIDAQASIEFGIEDDFYQAIYRFGEGLDHIADVESIRLTNLY